METKLVKPLLSAKGSDLRYLRNKDEKQGTGEATALNIDAILQIGSVMERGGIDQKRQEAFDWLAQNRDKVITDKKEVAKQLQTAIGDIPMSRELIKKSLEELIKLGKLTMAQYDKEFKVFEAAPDEQLPTLAQMAALLREFGGYLKQQ